MHTIKGGARMTGLFAIGDLSHVGETLLNLIANKKVTIDKSLLDKLLQVSDELFRLYEQAQNNEELSTPADLIESLQQLTEPSALDVSVAVESGSKDTAKEQIASTSTEQIDPMLAIYLEELSELLEAFDETTQKLVENPQDSGAIKDAERQLHTIKGGARMTGLLAIGDLSHAGESLLNLVSNQKVSAGESLLEQLQRVSDQLFRMYESAQNGTEIIPATELIESLQALSEQGDTQTRTDTTTHPKEVITENPLPDRKSKNQDLSETSTVLDPMMAIYLEELSELVEAFDGTTQKLLKNPQDFDAITDAERQLHTIKGGARMTGLLAIGDLSHAGESLLNLVANKKISTDGNLLEELQQVSDTLYKMYESASSGQTIEPASQLINKLLLLSDLEIETEKKDTQAQKDVRHNLFAESSEVLENTSLESGIKDESITKLEKKTVLDSSQTDKETTTYRLPDFKQAKKGKSVLEQVLSKYADDLSQANLQLVDSPLQAATAEAEKQNNSSIRVPIELVNQLITSSNEWGHQNIRLSGQYEESGRTIAELRRTANRLKEQIRNLELEADSSIHSGGPVSSLPKLKGSFDPLEMDEYTELQQQSRSLGESLEDLMSLTETLEMGLKSAEEVSDAQERTFKSIQEGLISTRMTKVTGLLSRLKRIVRQVSSELGKQVVVEIADENCEMDRTILERITASLEHLIRNSLAHGIEKPADRIKAGKPPQGKIILKIDRDGPEVVITLMDDGAGIDIEKLRALSIKKGLISEDTVLSGKETYQLILMSGVSTASKVSQVAGRGVGMDVVNAEVNALGGNIIIDSEFGKFTRFELRVPYNLATNQLMFMEVSGELLAVSVSKLEGMQRISLPDLNAAYARKDPALELGNKHYRLRHLGETLGLVKQRRDEAKDKTLPVVLFEENGQRIAYQVDEIRGSREVMLKPLDPVFEQSKLLSSVAIQGGGEIVLVLNAHELISLAINRKVMYSHKLHRDKNKVKRSIMVVDDSITVRKITENLLISLGYDVITANDGVNALEVLADEKPDLILLDIEMPRMDGFELLENIRRSAQWKQLPVIMISSRSGSKHRHYANELGANGFIGKPWETKQLANNIEACLKETMQEVTVS